MNLDKPTWETFVPLAEAILADIGLHAGIGTGSVPALAKRLCELHQKPLQKVLDDFVHRRDVIQANLESLGMTRYDSISDKTHDEARWSRAERHAFGNAAMVVIDVMNNPPTKLGQE